MQPPRGAQPWLTIRGCNNCLTRSADSGRTPEEVCGDCPELLPEVRRRWLEIRIVEAELDALFPAEGSAPSRAADRGGATRILRRTRPWTESGSTPGKSRRLRHRTSFRRAIPRRSAATGSSGGSAQGGFGRVYLARDDDLDRPVAIKVPSPERVSGPDDVEDYLREARALARLDHPHIVPVHDVGRTEDGLCYVVSKYVEGSDLAERMRQGRWSFRESAELVAAVAEALHHAHTRGLVHRDIKPANILIDPEGQPCVADFGLALRDEDFGKEAQLAGTPAYMSPEQARGEGHRVDGRSDIFSLGVVFYELLTGRQAVPGRRRTPRSSSRSSPAEPRPPRQIDDTIPSELERICLKMLAKRASERYSTARDLADDLRHFLQAEAASGLPRRLPTLPRRPTPGDRPPPARPDSDGAGRQGRPQGPAVVRPQRRRLLPRAAPRPPRPRRPAREPPVLEDPDRGDRLRHHVQGRADLRPLGLRQVVAGQGGLAAPAGQGRAGGVHRGDAGGDRGPAAAGAAQGLSRPATPDWASSMRWRRCGGGGSLRPGQKVLLVLDQFEQWLFARRGERGHRAGRGAAAVRRRARPGDRHGPRRLLDGGDPVHAATWRSIWSPVRTSPSSTSSTCATPARCWRRSAGPTARLPETNERAVPGPGAVPRSSDRGPRPGRQGHLGAAGAVRRDGQGQALDPGDVAGGRRHRGCRRDLPGGDLQLAPGQPQAPPAPEGGAGRAQGPAAPDRAPTSRARCGRRRSCAAASGYAGSAPRLRRLDPHPRPRAAADHADRSRELDRRGLIRQNRSRALLSAHPRLPGPLAARLADPQAAGDPPGTGRAAAGRSRRRCGTAKPENRHLPSVLEWANIRLLTKKSDWTEPQRRMMRRAGRVHGLRGLGLAILIALATWGGIEGYGTLRAAALVESLKTASTTRVPALIEQLRAYRRWAGRPLAGIVVEYGDGQRSPSPGQPGQPRLVAR